jgi:Palmitoyl protein thioesterase
VAARFWQWVLAGHLLVSAALAGLLVESRPALAAVGLALAIALAVPALLLAASFVVALVCARGDESPLISRIALALRAFVTEVAQFPSAILLMMGAARRPVIALGDLAPAVEPIPGSRPRPVLLIHGILCNHAIWSSWFARLEACGLAPVRAIDLEPLLADIESHTAKVVDELRAMQRRCDGARVAIIAHSRGGLIARAALRRLGPGVISQVITLASPHHGTVMARLFPGKSARDMRPRSAWLCALGEGEGTPAVPFTSIYSMQDNLVVPARSSTLNGAQLHELHGLGHLALVGHRRSIDCAIGALKQA